MGIFRQSCLHMAPKALPQICGMLRASTGVAPWSSAVVADLWSSALRQHRSPAGGISCPFRAALVWRARGRVPRPPGPALAVHQWSSCCPVLSWWWGWGGAPCFCPHGFPPPGRKASQGFHCSPEAMTLAWALRRRTSCPNPRDTHLLALTFRRVFFRKGKWGVEVGRLCVQHWEPGWARVGRPLREWGFLVLGTARDLGVTLAHTLRNEEFLKFYPVPDYPLLRGSPCHAVLCQGEAVPAFDLSSEASILWKLVHLSALLPWLSTSLRQIMILWIIPLFLASKVGESHIFVVVAL